MDVLLSPFCGLNDGSHTESLQRSTGKVPPLHQRRGAEVTSLTLNPVRRRNTHMLPSTCDTTEYSTTMIGTDYSSATNWKREICNGIRSL